MHVLYGFSISLNSMQATQTQLMRVLMKNLSIKNILAASIGLMCAGAALAATSETTFEVTAKVNDSCRVAATNLVFGIYDPNEGNLDGSSIITATCTKGTTYNIGLDAGLNASNATAPWSRAMAADGEYLSYELYSNADRSTVWGDTIDTDTVEVLESVGGDEAHSVYGRIPAAQYVPAGNYVDTINVTITF